SVITSNLAFTATAAGASQGGGIYTQDIGALRLISGTIANNTANQGGGLYLASACNLDLADVTFTGNLASLDLNHLEANGNAGGIYAADALTLTNGVLRDNLAHNSGGGLYASSYLAVTGSHFFSNTSTSPFTVTPPNPNGGGGAYAVL